VLAQSEVYGDLGRCAGNNIEPTSVPNDDMPIFFTLEHTKNYCNIEELKQNGVIWGQMVTVSCSSASRQACCRITSRFPDAICENMEGASGAMVCDHFNIPFLELRGISNIAGETAVEEWHIDEALAAVSETLHVIVEQVCKQAKA
jgi:futalosine hydrolase